VSSGCIANCNRETSTHRIYQSQKREDVRYVAAEGAGIGDVGINTAETNREIVGDGNDGVIVLIRSNRLE
jgi:hypothetical protein